MISAVFAAARDLATGHNSWGGTPVPARTGTGDAAICAPAAGEARPTPSVESVVAPIPFVAPPAPFRPPPHQGCCRCGTGPVCGCADPVLDEAPDLFCLTCHGWVG